MTTLRQKLALATCALVTGGAQAVEQNWAVDTSYLSYTESNNRVAVSKTLANLTRTLNDGNVTVNLVHDTMSGASPTGAIRSSDSAVTFSSASGGGGFAASTDSDYSLSPFEDTRIQFGLSREQLKSRALTFSYGGVVSQESDYDSMGANVGVKRESTNKLSTVSASFAATFDSIYRSDSGTTPQPLRDVNRELEYGKGQRNTFDSVLGVTRVLNRNTLMQVNASLGLSQGYHSDPYKIISAADENDRILANFHDSRPESRLRSSLFAKVVHQLQGSRNSIHLSYRLYQDSWGIASNTADFRYHHQLTRKQYLEPHVRLYRQNAADFYQRKLSVDDQLNPVMPEDGFASADYRLDALTSATLGVKYGFSITRNTDMRIRAEYVSQLFDNSDYGTNTAVVLQTSLKYRF
ncbi:MAG: DUF3570 domain-containing protein [Granulosicoccus sp.]